ncbi:MAG TPA: DUF4097 family beta strand repeat-containing protein [Gemmatimonadaceae bacterium]|jgi:DUF4097 and DUF4098 domain-containing protein YvlB
MTSLRTFILPALAAGLLISVPARDAAAQSRRSRARNGDARIDTTFAFDKNGSVTINGGSGDIVVTGWSRNQVHINAVSDDNEGIRLNTSSGQISLSVSSANRGSDTHFEVSVPYGVRVLATTWSGDVTMKETRGQVEIHSQNGDIDVDDVATRLDVNTLSGDLHASNVNGDVEVVSVSGDVKLNDVHGNVDVASVSGDIELRGMTTKLARAKTTSGDVTYDGLIDPAGRYDLSAHSGDIRLHIPRDASAQLNISTWNGGIDSDFPITLKPGENGIGRRTAKAFTFEIGGGAARISADTFSGDITISSNGHGASNRR